VGAEVAGTGAEGAAPSQGAGQQGAQSVNPGSQTNEQGGNTQSTGAEQSKKTSVDPEIETFVKKHNIQGFDPSGIDEKTMPFVKDIVNRYNTYDKGAQEKFRQAAESEKQLAEYRTRYEKEQAAAAAPQGQEKPVNLSPIETVDSQFIDKIKNFVDAFGFDSEDALFEQYPEIQKRLSAEYQMAKMEATANMGKHFFDTKEREIQEKAKAQEAEQRFKGLQDSVLSMVDERKKVDPEFGSKMISAGTDEIVSKISAISKIPSAELMANRDFFNFLADAALAKHELNDLKKQLPSIKEKAAKEHEERVMKSKQNEGVSASGGSSNNDEFFAKLQRMNKY
jgi:hypothetical protein